MGISLLNLLRQVLYTSVVSCVNNVKLVDDVAHYFSQNIIAFIVGDTLQDFILCYSSLHAETEY